MENRAMSILDAVIKLQVATPHLSYADFSVVKTGNVAPQTISVLAKSTSPCANR